MLTRNFKENDSFQLVKTKTSNANDLYLGAFKLTTFNLQNERTSNPEQVNQYWITELDNEAKNFACNDLDQLGKGKR